MTSNAGWAPIDSNEHQRLHQSVASGGLHRFLAALRPYININLVYGDGMEGHTVLHEAADRGNLQVIQYLLANGASVDILDEGEFGCCTPLFYAAQRAQVDTVRLLLDAGANVNIPGAYDNTILSAVLPNAVQVRQAHLDTINLLLDHGIDVDAKACDHGPTALQQAIKIASQPLIKLLISRGASLKHALGVAAEFHQNTDTVKFLIDQGANDADSYALSRAAGWNKADIAQVLLAHSSDPEYGNGPYGPLQKAAFMGHMSMLRLLIDHGLNINSMDEWGETPLITACSINQPKPELIQMLLDRGADVNCKVEKTSGSKWQENDTPLHVSAQSSHPETVRILLKAGADTNSRNKLAETPLIRFAYRLAGQTLREEASFPRLDAFRLLLASDSDVNAVDLQGRNALHYLAAGRYRDETGNNLRGARLLLAKGINPLARDGAHKTAADLLQPGEVDFVQLIDSYS